MKLAARIAAASMLFGSSIAANAHTYAGHTTCKQTNLVRVWYFSGLTTGQQNTDQRWGVLQFALTGAIKPATSFIKLGSIGAERLELKGNIKVTTSCRLSGIVTTHNNGGPAIDTITFRGQVTFFNDGRGDLSMTGLDGDSVTMINAKRVLKR